MASRYRTAFSQLKTSAGAPPSSRKGAAHASSRPMKTKAWASPSPTRKVGFNARTKSKVVNQYPAKQGLD